jgi:hypothetical protein
MEEFEAPQAIKEMLATQRTYVAPELLVYAEAPKKAPKATAPVEVTEETEESCKAKGLAYNPRKRRCDRASKTAASLKLKKPKKKKTV